MERVDVFVEPMWKFLGRDNVVREWVASMVRVLLLANLK